MVYVHVVIYLIRARPVIHLIKTLEVTPEIVDPKDCDNW